MNSPPGSCIPLNPDLTIQDPTAPPGGETKPSFPVVPVAVVGVVALGALGAFLLFRG